MRIAFEFCNKWKLARVNQQGRSTSTVASLVYWVRPPIRRLKLNIDVAMLKAPIIKRINKFEIFLLPKPFVIETDNTQVAGFIKNNIGKGVQDRRLSRWQTLLSYYNFKIVHRKCTDNFLVDFLSRNVE